MPECVAFEGPDGELMRDPTPEAIAALLRDRGAAYWRSGSGSASLGWIRYDSSGFTPLLDRPSLHFLVHPDWGVHLNARFPPRTAGEEGASLAPITNSSATRVSHDLGGAEASFPAASFVPVDVAEAIFSEFLADPLSLTPSARVNWLPLFDTGDGVFNYQIEPPMRTP